MWCNGGRSEVFVVCGCREKWKGEKAEGRGRSKGSELLLCGTRPVEALCRGDSSLSVIVHLERNVRKTMDMTYDIIFIYYDPYNEKPTSHLHGSSAYRAPHPLKPNMKDFEQGSALNEFGSNTNVVMKGFGAMVGRD
jgi:hypothetical protein